MPITIEIAEVDHFLAIAGENDRNLSLIERHMGVTIYAKGAELTIKGERSMALLAERLIMEMRSLAEKRIALDERKVTHMMSAILERPHSRIAEAFSKTLKMPRRGRDIQPKTRAQACYIDAMERHDVTFGIGPAGTGKTYLAVALATVLLFEERYDRIVLTRPVVEAGESLGYLPGDVTQKISPYMRPLYDALEQLMPYNRYRAYLDENRIEVAPLAYMRGRTLSNAFIILDEAQNTTIGQMKMFLSRIGEGSKAVVTGDVTQTDLPRNAASGLLHAERILSRIEGIAFHYFDHADVVRHELVRKILEAYERDGKTNENLKREKRHGA